MKSKERIENRGILVQIKLSSEEDNLIQEKAKKLGLSKSIFLRMLGLKYEN